MSPFSCPHFLRHEIFTVAQHSSHAVALELPRMFDLSQLILFELRSAGGRLWESVACDRSSDRWIVYANLRPGAPEAAGPSFAESAQILRTVLDNRLSAKD